MLSQAVLSWGVPFNCSQVTDHSKVILKASLLTSGSCERNAQTAGLKQLGLRSVPPHLPPGSSHKGGQPPYVILEGSWVRILRKTGRSHMTRTWPSHYLSSLYRNDYGTRLCPSAFFAIAKTFTLQKLDLWKEKTCLL